MIPVVVGSSPIGHPSLTPRRWRAPALRGATPQAAFQRVLEAASGQIEANARGALASTDPEFLHQLRVGMRRLRAALRAFQKILDKKETKPLRRALRKLSPDLGAARDWDVLVARLESGRAPSELLARARTQRDAARRAARGAIDSKAFSKILQQARSIAAEESAKTLPQFAAAALTRAQRKLEKQARDIDWQDPARRHAVRIRVKRLRYSCEFFAPAFSSTRAAPYMSALRALQEILGELNDIAVARELLPELDSRDEEARWLRSLAPAWAAFEKRPIFWRARE